jgi:uncharacterized protein
MIQLKAVLRIDGLRLLSMAAKRLLAAFFCLYSVIAFANVEPGVKALERGHHSTALRAWLPLAREGDPKAQNNVGLMYERGLGVTQSYPDAMNWYRQAAEQGLPEAHHNLGLLYYSGFGTAVNDREAFRRFRAAAEKELPESQYMLGLMVYEGRATEANPQIAKGLFEAAALQGYAEAQYMLAFVLQSGDLGTPNPMAAFVWSKIAQDQGIELAGELNYMTTLVLDEAEQARAAQLTDLCRASNYTDCPK